MSFRLEIISNMLNLKTLTKLRNCHKKSILVRVDFNEPLIITEPNIVKLGDDSRIQNSLPTIYYLLKQQAKIILISHCGEPGGQIDPHLSLQPQALRLGILLKRKVLPFETKIGNKNIKYWLLSKNSKPSNLNNHNLESLLPGDIVLLENLRFYPEEEKCDLKFAKQLSKHADIYVNEAFSVSHRKHASVVGVPKYLPSYAGLNLFNEIRILNRLTQPKTGKPFTLILGGAKITDKILIIKHLINKVNHVLLGGIMANTFMAARGIDIGESKIDAQNLKPAKDILKKHSSKIIFPNDVLISNRQENRTIKVGDSIPPKWIISDVGKDTFQSYATILKQSKTIVWNGPLGILENKFTKIGTINLTKLLAKLSMSPKIFVALGGGETIEAIRNIKKSQIDYISTGGGAMLNFLAGKKLPGIQALQNTTQQN